MPRSPLLNSLISRRPLARGSARIGAVKPDAIAFRLINHCHLRFSRRAAADRSPGRQPGVCVPQQRKAPKGRHRRIVGCGWSLMEGRQL